MVVILNGRYAGRKAVIVKNFDEGTSSRPYGHALVCGIANYPRKARGALAPRRSTRRATVRRPTRHWAGMLPRCFARARCARAALAGAQP